MIAARGACCVKCITIGSLVDVRIILGYLVITIFEQKKTCQYSTRQRHNDIHKILHPILGAAAQPAPTAEWENSLVKRCDGTISRSDSHKNSQFVAGPISRRRRPVGPDSERSYFSGMCAPRPRAVIMCLLMGGGDDWEPAAGTADTSGGQGEGRLRTEETFDMGGQIPPHRPQGHRSHGSTKSSGQKA